MQPLGHRMQPMAAEALFAPTVFDVTGGLLVVKERKR